MAPHPVFTNGLNGSDNDKTITVLVTGFGPFQSQYPINPSWEIARSLPELLAPQPGENYSIRIINSGSPIRVAYKDAKTIIPKLLQSHNDHVDLTLHMGMAAGRQFYTAERYGHRDGYQSKHKDVDGLSPPEDEVEKEFPDCPPLMTTSLDFSWLVRTWQEIIQRSAPTSPAFGADVRPSDNAGYYICDYTYFNSLTWYGRRSETMEGGKAKDRPVMFLHVPAESDAHTLERGRAVAVALIRAMVAVYLDQSERQ